MLSAIAPKPHRGIAYSTGANPGTNPSNNGFPSPLLNSASYASTNPNVVGSSPVGWTVDVFDDFTGTMTLGNRTSTYGSFDPVLGSTNSFTTGALYNGNPIVYGTFPSNTWGGYGGIQTLQNISMGSSLLTYNLTNSSGTIHGASTVLCAPSPWGYWEWAVKPQHGANGSRSGCEWGLWTSGSTWPSQGEFDIIESAVGVSTSGGLSSNIHSGNNGSTNVSSQNSIWGSNPFPGGGTWDDGNFHIIGAFITPSYLASYVDGRLIGFGSATTSGTVGSFLFNLSTTADPPSSTTAGSFGFNAASLVGSFSSLTSSSPSYNIIAGYVCTSGASTAITPTKMDMDWWRHSKLYPASGGPHA